jgi:hypothetical protein
VKHKNQEKEDLSDVVQQLKLKWKGYEVSELERDQVIEHNRLGQCTICNAGVWVFICVFINMFENKI